MDNEQVVAKLAQIEEQARLALEELPKHLTKERLRFIIALARFTRGEMAGRSDPAGETHLEGMGQELMAREHPDAVVKAPGEPGLEVDAVALLAAVGGTFRR